MTSASNEMPVDARESTRRNGGEVLAEMLRLHEVGDMYGMGGFQLLPFYESVRKSGLRHVLINDERSGAFAADAGARMSGRPGVCDGTMGPGATNLVTPLVESMNAGIPMIAIVGEGHRTHRGKNMTQETFQDRILGPCVKEYIRIEDGCRIPELVRRAYTVATSGRPGPVVLAMPEDISHESFEIEPGDLWADPATVRAPMRRIGADPEALETAAAALRNAERPLLLVGGGIHISRAYAPLLELSESQQIPVAHTLSGKGSVPCSYDLSVGIFGRYSRYANDLIAESDCLLVVGCKLGEIATKRYAIPGRDSSIIHIDIEPEELGRWARTETKIWADARLALQDLVDVLGSSRPDRQEYVREVHELQEKWRAERAAAPTDTRPIEVSEVVAALNEAMPADGVLIADGGFASHWAGLYYDTKAAGRGFVTDRGFASIGYGLPGCLGVKLAEPGKVVVGLTGDGGLNMSIGDLETACRVGAGFTLIVLNNAASGYVKALQHAVYGPDAYQSSDLGEVDYAKVAAAYGARGVRVERVDQLKEALAGLSAESTTPTVIDVVVTRDPAKMLPGVDSRTMTLEKGDRPV